MNETLVCPRCGELPTIWQEWLTGPWYVGCPNCTEWSGKTRALALKEWDDQPYVLDLIRKIMVLESKLSQALKEQIENDSLDC